MFLFIEQAMIFCWQGDLQAHKNLCGSASQRSIDGEPKSEPFKGTGALCEMLG